jgi:putative ABC transport system substrate-binding protein
VDEARKRIFARRRTLMALAAMPLFAIGLHRVAMAATPKRLGILALAVRQDALKYFSDNGRKRLADRGWIEGQTLAIEWRFADMDDSRHVPLARELVEARVDVIATWGTSATRAVQQATRTIPIATGVTDPVGYGFAKSLARPGGNITGLSYSTPEITQKEFEFLRGLLPKLSHLLFLTRGTLESLRERARPAVAAAGMAGINVEFRQVATIGEIEAAFRALPSGGRGAINMDSSVWGLPGAEPQAFAEMAIRHRVAMMEWVDAGGLMSYTLRYEDADERFAAVIDKVLRGGDPAVIPFEIPTKSTFVINRRTATALGIRISPEKLLRADRVID